jgi:hypothetical protein
MRSDEVRTNTYHRGREALRDIEADTEKGLTYLKWMAICEALDEARKEAKEEVGLADSNLPTHRLGGGYNKAFGKILSREKLNSNIINSTTRSHAFSVIEHRVDIERWRTGLDRARHASLNHPSSIWRAFSATAEFRAAHPKPAKPKSPWGNRQMPPQPKVEAWAQPGSGKPTAEHIERAAQKQAAEAEAEAKKLGTVEAETDKLRERVRLAEMAKAALESEVEELKAAGGAENAPSSMTFIDLVDGALGYASEATDRWNAASDKSSDADMETWQRLTSRQRTKMGKLVAKLTDALADLSALLEAAKSEPGARRK